MGTGKSSHELGGSGINIFIYHLDDGSIVSIGAADTGPLLYANHIASSGKSSDAVNAHLINASNRKVLLRISGDPGASTQALRSRR